MSGFEGYKNVHKYHQDQLSMYNDTPCVTGKKTLNQMRGRNRNPTPVLIFCFGFVSLNPYTFQTRIDKDTEHSLKIQ